MTDAAARRRLARALEKHPRALQAWLAASPTRQKDMLAWIEEPRTRLFRADRRRRLRDGLENGFWYDGTYM